MLPEGALNPNNCGEHEEVRTGPPVGRGKDSRRFLESLNSSDSCLQERTLCGILGLTGH
jgi:hypothetical protein